MENTNQILCTIPVTPSFGNWTRNFHTLTTVVHLRALKDMAPITYAWNIVQDSG